MENNFLDILDDQIAEDEGEVIKRNTGTIRIPEQDQTLAAINEQIAYDEKIHNDPNIDPYTGLQDNLLRAKMSFADTPEGREGILKEAGYETKRTPSGVLLYKNKKTNMMTRVDERRLSLADLSDLLGELPETAGDIAGTAIGGIYGGPPGAVYGGALGAMTGRMAKKGIGKAIGIKEDPHLARDLAASGGASLVGSGLVKFGSKVAAPFKSTLHAGAESGQKLAQDYGTNMTAAQMTKSGTLDFGEALIEGSFGGGVILHGHKQGQRKLWKTMMDDIVEGLGGDVNEQTAYYALQQSIEGKAQFFTRDIMAPMYGKIDDATLTIRPKSQHVKDVIKPYTDALKYTEEEAYEPAFDAVTGVLIPGGKRKVTKEMMKSTIPDQVRSIFDDISELPEEITFKQAQIIRSRLLTTKREAARQGLIGTESQGQLDQAIKAFTKVMDDAASGASGDVAQLVKSVNALYKMGAEQFNDDFIRKMADKNPEKIAGALFTKRNITNIRKVRRILGGDTDKVWDKLQAAFLDNSMQAKNFGDPTSGTAAKQLRSYLDNLGDSTLREIFPDTSVRNGINHVIDTAIMAEDKGLASGAGVAMKLTQFGMAIALLNPESDNVDRAAAAAVIIAPSMLAKLLISKQGSKWLSTGLTAGRGTTESIKAITKILTFTAKAEMADKRFDMRSKDQKPTTTGRIPTEPLDYTGKRPFDY